MHFARFLRKAGRSVTVYLTSSTGRSLNSTNATVSSSFNDYNSYVCIYNMNNVTKSR